MTNCRRWKTFYQGFCLTTMPPPSTSSLLTQKRPGDAGKSAGSCFNASKPSQTSVTFQISTNQVSFHVFFMTQNLQHLGADDHSLSDDDSSASTGSNDTNYSSNCYYEAPIHEEARKKVQDDWKETQMKSRSKKLKFTRGKSMVFFNKTKDQWLELAANWFAYYTTAFFVVLTAVSVVALIFLVPFFIDPAWSTLKADFIKEGVTCTTILGQYLEGRSNCQWSSCQEGCTNTVFTCWHVQVRYMDELGAIQTGNLFPNVKVCKSVNFLGQYAGCFFLFRDAGIRQQWIASPSSNSFPDWEPISRATLPGLNRTLL